MKLLILLAFSLVLLNCTRKKSETSTVTIQLPVSQKSSAVMTSKVSAFSVDELPDNSVGSNNSDDFGDDVFEEDAWSSIVPVGLSSSTSNAVINCYGVFVGIPSSYNEVGMNEKSCSKKTATGSLTEMVRFGPWKGIVADGGTLEITVPSSASIPRVFTLIGFYAEDTANCKDLTQGNVSKSDLSKPYIIGTSSPVLLSGGEVTVNITKSWDTNKYIDECDFKDSSSGPDDFDTTPSSLKIVKREFPAGAAGYATANSPGSCYPIDIHVVNKDGQPVKAVQSISSSLYRINSGYTLPAASSLVLAGTYNDQSHCEIGTDGSNAFIIAANESYIRRWVPLGGGTETVDYFSVKPSTSSGLSDSPLQHVRIHSATSQLFDIVGPKHAMIGSCVPYKVFLRYFNGEYENSTSYSISAFTKDSSGAEDFSNSFSDATCSTPLSASSTVPFTTAESPYSATIYVKYNFNAYENVSLVVSKYSSGTAVVYPHKAQISLSAFAGTTSAKKLKISSNTQYGPINTCIGPFTVNMVNDAGSIVTQNVAKTFSLKSISGVTYYSAMDGSFNCDSSNLITSLSIPANQYHQIFYIQSTSVGNKDIEVEDPSGSLIEDKYQFTFE